ncbi:uncharacterized protein LOC129876867 [Solanum dulcamara]|uniref:uncharacterized protein LOC129876867 n=1 Tax=Solanum dulcamara TaxID=45834 RepID=UPI0024852744|nr:uncharacterized protein LOC129876867 [Solanum dulcamara]
MNKSFIYFGGVTDQMKETILHQFQFNYGEFPFKYLGIPLSTKKLSLMQWTPLVNKIIARITSWTAKKLSYAGRMQLVQSVLFGIQAYWSQLFIIPTKVLKLIEAYCRSFIWSSTNTITKRALIAWEKMCLPKSAGGMRLINIHLWNQVAIAKTYWDLAHKTDKLWIRWIHSYYIKSHIVFNVSIPQQASWMIRKILAARVILEQIHTQRDSPTTANFYVHLLGNRPTAPWKNMMFNNSARPKAIVTMWIMLQNKLPTIDRLTSWGMDVNQQCKLCQQELENRKHLFTQCEFTRAIWKKLLNLIKWPLFHADTWDMHLEWTLKQSKGKSHNAQLFKLIYVECSYAIWMERNQRTFEEKRKNYEEITKEIAYMCTLRDPLAISTQLQQSLLF